MILSLVIAGVSKGIGMRMEEEEMAIWRDP